MHRTRLVCVSFVLLFTTASVSSALESSARYQAIFCGSEFQTDWSIVASGVVVGADDGDTVVSGTRCSDPSCTPVIWNTP